MEDKMPSQEKATEESGLIKTTTRRKARAKAQVVQEEKEKQERVATKKDLVTYYCPKTHLIRIKFAFTLSSCNSRLMILRLSSSSAGLVSFLIFIKHSAFAAAS